MAKSNDSVRRSRPPALALFEGGNHDAWLRRWVAVGLFILVCAVYLPVIHHGFVDWDDTDNFIRNEDFRGLAWKNISWMFTTFHMGHYQPLTWLSLGLDFIWGGIVFGVHPEYGYGMDPRSFHITNVLIHAVNSVLVFVIAGNLMRRANPAGTIDAKNPWPVLIGAAFAAALFGIHPLRVESVAWATERRDLLSGFFLLLAMFAYLRIDRPGQTYSRLWYGLTVLFFGMSLLSKVIGVTLPVVLLILDWYPLRRLNFSKAAWHGSGNVRVLLEKLPLFAMSLVFAAVASIGQGRNNWLVSLEDHGVAARIMQSFYGLAFFAWKTIAPADLSPLYQIQFPLNPGEARFVASAIVVIGAALAIFMLRRRQPALLAAGLVYAVMLSPVLGLVQNGTQLVADRYSYLPCIGLAVLAGAGLTLIWRTKRRTLIIVAGAVAAAAVVALAVLTMRQIGVWRDTESLWTRVYLHDPTSGFAQNGYGFVLLQNGRIDEAVAMLEQAVKTLPKNTKAHYNFWNALKQKGDSQSLISAYEAAMKIDSMAVAAGTEYGTYLLGQGDTEHAAEILRGVLEKDPTQAKATTNLGVALLRQGHAAESITVLRKAIELDPQSFFAHYNLGLAFRSAGQIAEAIAQLRTATQLQPDNQAAQSMLNQLLSGRP